MTALLAILIGYTVHIGNQRLHISHTYISVVYLYTQIELGHCDLILEIYDNFVKTHVPIFLSDNDAYLRLACFDI